MDTLTRTEESSAPGARLLLAFELSQRDRPRTRNRTTACT